jgi:hypothetical protein
MQSSVKKPPGPAAGRILFLIMAAGLLAQCSSAGVEGLFVDPATYRYYDCRGLNAQATAKLKRLSIVNGLVQKAEREPSGVVIAATTYRSEQATLHADLRNIRRFAVEKNCDPLPPASAQ